MWAVVNTKEKHAYCDVSQGAINRSRDPFADHC